MIVACTTLGQKLACLGNTATLACMLSSGCRIVLRAHRPCLETSQQLRPALLQGNLWKRKGWAEMDKMRAKLEDLRELRDLVRSLGRGGGWGPLRRAPIQYLDLKARPCLALCPPSSSLLPP